MICCLRVDTVNNNKGLFRTLLVLQEQFKDDNATPAILCVPLQTVPLENTVNAVVSTHFFFFSFYFYDRRTMVGLFHLLGLNACSQI